MDDLAKKKRVRGGHRASAKKLVTKMEEIVASVNSESTEKDLMALRQGQIALKDKITLLKQLDGQIIDVISDSKDEDVDNQVCKEIEESDEIIAEFEKTLLTVKATLRKFGAGGEQSGSLLKSTQPSNEENLNDSCASTSSVGKSVRAKLPKLQLRNFDGKICEWPEFWDGFSSSIDNNDQLSDVDKFAYLRGFLEGPAKSTIAGLSLTEANYKCAVELLKKRFEKKATVQRAHINQLLQLPAVFKERDTTGMRKLYDSCEAHNRALKALGVKEETYSAIVVPCVMEKLPEHFRLTITRDNNFLEWSMEEMLKAFEKELELREAHNGVGTNTERDIYERDGRSKRFGKHSSAAALLANGDTKVCAFCLKNHPHEDCTGVTDPKTRKNVARKYGRCFICLSKGHRASNCRNKSKCSGCNGSHHVALCDKDREVESKEEKSACPENEPKLANVNTSVQVTSPNSNMHVGTGSLVALQTARGILRGEREARVRVLFDTGSHRSFVTSKAANLVQPKGIRWELLGIDTFGQKCVNAEQREVVELKLESTNGNKVISLEAFVVPEICSVQNSHVELARREYPHLKNIWFSDVCKSDEQLEIDVLIGSDYLWYFQTGITKRGKLGEPVAIETRLGWVLSGPLKMPNLDQVTVAQVNFVGQGNDLSSLEKNVERLWSFEGLGIVEKDDKVHEEFLDGITFTGSRYSVKLPWKEGHDRLPDNYLNSLSRMKSQLKRLKRDPELLKEYDTIIREQVEAGIVEEVAELDKVDKVHYLPHQAVVRKDAVTTKVRIVYDASSKESKIEASLNDCLHVGPSLNPLLYNILLRFRENRIALVGDIEKAFLNVEVDEADRDSLRFLWVKDIDSKVHETVVYRFCRVVFGLNASPFLLNATLRHHILKYLQSDPKFVQRVLESFYVDDLVSGESTAKKALELYDNCKTRMASEGFSLRKWLTNSDEVSREIDCQEKQVGNLRGSINDDESYAKLSLGATEGDSTSQKVLGQVWDNKKDELKIEIGKVGKKAKVLLPTKRSLLSVLASLFDPLGLISPVIVFAKILFQEVFKQKIDWDANFTEETLKGWDAWCHDLIKTREIITARCIYQHPIEEIVECSLHGFGDASKRAYCAVIYFVYRTNVGVYVRMLTTKSRVAPLKETSIPRLELMSARLLAQVMNTVRDSLKNQVKIDYVRFWLDSMTALYWIMNKGEWKQFVHHRVNEILRLTNKEEWGHCPGVENPADIGSRSCMGSQLVKNKLWWEGPDWLRKTVDDWPKFEANEKTSTVIEEQKRSAVMLVEVTQPKGVSSILDIKAFGTAERLFRVTAWILRFISNIKAKVKKRKHCRSTSDLNVVELEEAERVWVKEAQAALKRSERYGQMRNSLGIEEEEGILRCKGRFRNSDLEFNAKYPIIIPKEHRLTELIVQQCHKEIHHCGVRATLNRLRTKYWVVKGRQMVKKTIGNCVICKKLEGKPYKVAQAADLPDFRVREAAPFSKVGVDFAGPLFAKCCKDGTDKVYIALFSCCVTRAIHLELVRDLSAETFLCSFRRFVARRGVPSLIVSENAKTFKASEKAIRRLFNQPKVKSEMQTKRVTWKFNLERAPWWGGFFERMVRSMKRCLRKVLGNAKLTVDELNTVLVEVEGTLNARPLTEEYEEFEGEVLTPSHLIYGRAISFIPEREEVKEEVSCGQRFKYITVKLEHFWKRWRDEYLTGLREYHKCRSGSKESSLKKGDMVTVFGEGEKRGKWKLAVVEELIVGKDQRIRGAKVRVAGKGKPIYLKRPLQKLYPLEIQARPGGKGEAGNAPVTRTEGILHERTKRVAAVNSREKTRAMLDS